MANECESLTNCVLVKPETGVESETVLSDDDIALIQWILFIAICQPISIFGAAANIINIICFIKQGFKDPVVISFLGLAISDLGCLTTLILVNICFCPALRKTDLTFDTIDVPYVLFGIVNRSFSRVTCWITAFITLERCLCIAAPLKVKMMFTPKRTVVIIVTIFVFMLVSSAPVYNVNRLGLKYFPEKNRTLLGLIPDHHKEKVESICFMINTIVPSVAFVIIIVCTVTLVTKLYEMNKWRMNSTKTTQTEKVSARNKTVAKMVVMISILFLVCFIPLSILLLAVSLNPAFTLDGENRNMSLLFGGLGLAMEAINSSLNIFIYYRMSFKYKKVFYNLFSLSRGGLQINKGQLISK